MANAIEVQGLQKSFKIGNKTAEAVRGISLSVRQCGICGFLGPNGAGKTTCQRMLTTLLPVNGGTAEIADFDVKKKPREVRRHIGYVSQLGGTDLPATGRETLMLAGRLCAMTKKDTQKNHRNFPPA